MKNNPLLALVTNLVLLAGYSTTTEAQRTPKLAAIETDGLVTFYIAKGTEESRYKDTDSELANWAIKAWEKSLDGKLEFIPGSESTSLLRLYWVPANSGQYGEMWPLSVNGKRGAGIFIRPNIDELGNELAQRAKNDSLFRDTIVYLTCLHELGHALGLSHTDDYADIMYSFEYGGEISSFFERYRNQVNSRQDIRKITGLSEKDISRAKALYMDTPQINTD
tara:strand:- start:2953 stop:3618 length:666 start_codon:yes stop_codon:yes gene_type:complete